MKLANLGGTKELAAGTDFNLVLTGGPYFAGTAAAAGPNSPVASAGMLEVFGDGSYFWQRYTGYNTGWVMYLRARRSDGVWNAWKSITAA